MQNVLKRKDMYLEGFQANLFWMFSSKSYVLDHSESFHMHIEKLREKKLRKIRKKTVFVGREGGSQKVADISATIIIRLP